MGKLRIFIRTLAPHSESSNARINAQPSAFGPSDHLAHQAARIAHRICWVVSSSINQKKAERQSVVTQGSLAFKPD